MRKVIVSEFVSLDGVIEDPGGAEGFEHGGWSIQLGSEEQERFKFDELASADALLLGRVTYKSIAAGKLEKAHQETERTAWTDREVLIR
jgi:dihydrofolate reductase